MISNHTQDHKFGRKFGSSGWAACALLTAALAGCGGGGGDSAGPAPTTQASGMVSLTTQNYEPIGQSVVSSTLYLTDSAGVVTGAQTSAGTPMLRAATDQALRGLRLPLPRATVVGAQTSQAVNCSRGGSLLVTLNDANNNGQMDAGDAMTMEARSCDEGDGVLNGTLQLNVQTATGDLNSNSYSATVQMTLRNFTVVNGADRSQGDGVITLQVAETPAGLQDVTLTVPSLTLNGTVAGAARVASLTNVKITSRREQVAGVWRTSVNFSGTFGGTGYDGKSATVSTIQPFVAVGTDLYPSSGQALISGANGSSLRLTAVNAQQVRFELDADGNGSYESSVLRNWSSLN